MRVVSVPALQASPLVVRGRRRSRRGAGDGGLVVVAPGLLAPLSGESCEPVGSHCSLLLSHGVHCKSKKKTRLGLAFTVTYMQHQQNNKTTCVRGTNK